ncbi:NUDIX domain-containing protein [Streptomyces oryzae]|uniref:NUDIX domain-containing protein n=1 Tax=Streptomyces oryzae TaxID=1434886 RepID=A0ABS3XCV9_9ACTN|nr:NUDIX domain-containing protein [Streptomyces oryzae]MBO8193119.1 NUDIX domain-containing protein [Streptomyces oryzae]
MTEQGRAADELLDIVDEQDRVIGQRLRGEVYAQRLRHRSTAIRVRDATGRIFVHRRTPTKLIFPGLYDVVVGGVVGAGEDYDTAALREAEEELGVSGLPQPARRLKFLFETPEFSWFLQVYEVVCTLPVQPQPEEVAWWDFLPEDELERRLADWVAEAAVVPDGLECHRRLTAQSSP